MSDMVPPYVPPHLRGRVGDFRMEPDGNVSFSDPTRGLGLGPDQSRKTLGKEQYQQTFDHNYRLGNMKTSLMGQYDSPAADPKDFITSVRDKLTAGLRGGLEYGTSSPGKAVGTAALITGLLAGGGGAWQASRNGESPWGRGALYALLGAGLGGGATALAQSSNARREAMLKQASTPDEIIGRALASDHGLSHRDKLELMNYVRNLRRQDADELSRLLRGAAGAGAGVLIARFLKMKGLLPMVAGGILGAVLASRQSPRQNALGQTSL